ncbi:MAG: anhydro-N-acetylmuramic acid kinase [Bacteroidales bacterium]
MSKPESLQPKTYKAIGIMSGTSVDGLDIALCHFTEIDGKWSLEILKTDTLPYSGTEWNNRLPGAERLSGLELMEVHRDFGRYTGNSINEFLKDVDIKPDLIASHGHTVFHQPEKRLTLQIGDGAEIAGITGITTVSDFRRLDVALGGQGAPLVPVGDELLFSDFSYCLNLGGFSNISFRVHGKRVAFDICPVNIVLNLLAGEKGKAYDHNGDIAREGIIVPELLESMETLDFYRLHGPKSLGKEWVDSVVLPLLEKSQAPSADKLRTFCEHIALRINAIIDNGSLQFGFKNGSGGSNPAPALLITGGGARNGFLTGLISEKTAPVQTIIPEDDLVDFKEAVIFAFLGVLRLRGEPNCLASVTGASRDNSGGIIHYC